MIAVVSLFVVVVVGLLIARIAAVALIATGLPADVARFQARSALTGVGYTTGEAETVVGHPLRRRIVMWLMLAGNAGFVIIVASLVLSFATSGNTGDALERLGIAVGGLLLLFLTAHSRWFERRLTALITRALGRFSDLDVRDMHHLMQLSRDYAVTELEVMAGDWLAERSLTDLELPDEGVIVLAVRRARGDFLGAPRGRTIVQPGDTLYLYGRASNLSDHDELPATPVGDEAHREAVAEQGVLEEKEEGEG
ncbi:MAG TPA: TrkA C-terminal domain-containing protein [Acidimicrobiia bacterium]|nr:TrkA C-terminal domain-containing protein [Acidimicrobiia bacterium]